MFFISENIDISKILMHLIHNEFDKFAVIKTKDDKF